MLFLQFRNDINGLRGIAVIAVVLFHFNEFWLPGGFAGVDVFFVISGFLMTRIIFGRIENDSFSILQFYIDRSNRIIPSLAVLCLVLIVFGMFFLAPIDYKSIGKHITSSMVFLSNLIYWKESGYFDEASHAKWLLHTWSLSVEWQFYIAYPLILVAARKYLSIDNMKVLVVLGTVLGFCINVLITYKSPTTAYFFLPSRAWEMMLGGIAYLYPINITDKRKVTLQYIGLLLIIGACFFISKETPWPGYLSLIPVVGTYLVIQAQHFNSPITGNYFLNKIGAWSYSIYLWHWPVVVAISYYSVEDRYLLIGVVISLFLGYLNYKFVENVRVGFCSDSFKQTIRKPFFMLSTILTLAGSIIYINNGFVNFYSLETRRLMNESKPSPYRDKCHFDTYEVTAKACEYFGSDITWATLGDSHSTEIAYALAKKLKSENIGVKQFSFSACEPSYGKSNQFSKCSQWYNESVSYILENEKIDNVVFNHRYARYLLEKEGRNSLTLENHELSNESVRMLNAIDELIFRLAEKKKNVYIFYPIPDLNQNIKKSIGLTSKWGDDTFNIPSSSLESYNSKNKFMIRHFDNSNYPSNVYLLKVQDVFCDADTCYSVKDGVPLYFDDNHPSVAGAEELVKLIKGI